MYDIKNCKNVNLSNNISGDKRLKDISYDGKTLYVDGNKVTDKQEVDRILKENGIEN